MQPVNVDERLHTRLKLHAVQRLEKLYAVMNRYILLGLWFDSLPDDQRAEINKSIDRFLIDKQIK